MIKKIIKIIIVIFIAYFSYLIRSKNYEIIPIPGQSVDEYSYSWVGLSLIKTGVPVGISGLSGYKQQYDRYINIDRFMQFIPSDPLAINYPWMDHPPLLGLITGGFAYLKGAEVFEDTVAVFIRKPIILISTVSVLLVMIYCWLNFSFLTAIFAGLVYGTAPLVVLSGRMIQAENAIIPCLLAVMISISLYIKKKKDVWLIVAAMFSGLATLFKLTGVVCYLFTFIFLLNYYKKDYKKCFNDIFYYLAISLPISFLYFIYGSVYGLENFKNIFLSNANRFYGIGSNLFLELIRNQRLTQHKFLTEVWIVVGWIVSLGYLIKKPKNIGVKIVLISLISYLMVYILFGSQPYGWYTFPFWPILIIALSRFLILGLEKGKNLLSVFIVSFIILGANIARLLGIFEFQPYSNIWRYGIFLILLLLSIPLSQNKKFMILTKIIVLIILMGTIYTNIKYLNLINIDFWWQNIS
jgi:4-amino-4-deoxy-L-arabinose transferase-like glycosyltransferase